MLYQMNFRTESKIKKTNPLNTQFSNIKKLEVKVYNGTPKYNFNARLEPEKIETVEKAYGIVFSESYKKFLARFNGGMILEHAQSFYTDMLEDEPDGPRWSSYWLFSLEELIEKYRDIKLDDWLLGDGFEGTYPIIPICRTPGPEHNLVFMISNKGLKAESPVFARFENSNISSCIQVADDFDSFIGWYVDLEGFPPIGSIVEAKSCSEFIKENKIIEIAGQKSSYQETIEQTTAMIELNPDDDWNYCERGNAYLYNGQTKAALKDFNTAIKMSPEEAFFYHCRGDLILRFGNSRKALIDMDIAVKLKPEDKMFLAGRADAFYKLGKLKKALADCNKVLEKDGRFYLALQTRYEIYKDLGEDEKAKIDSDLLTEIS